MSVPTLVPDPVHPGMFRIKIDGQLTDMVNLTRAKDTVAAYLETVERRRRAAAQPHTSPPIRLRRRAA
jgi:hypothetical protein